MCGQSTEKEIQVALQFTKRCVTPSEEMHVKTAPRRRFALLGLGKIQPLDTLFWGGPCLWSEGKLGQPQEGVRVNFMYLFILDCATGCGGAEAQTLGHDSGCFWVRFTPASVASGRQIPPPPHGGPRPVR